MVVIDLGHICLPKAVTPIICLNSSLARLTIDLSLPHGVGDSPGGGHDEKCISLQKRRERMLDWMSRKMSSNNLSVSFRKPTSKR